MKVFLFFFCEISIVIFGVVYFIIPIFTTPFYPTNLKKLRKMVELAKLKKDDQIIDLGSGDGRFVLYLASKGYNVRGVEINPFFVLITNFLLLVTGNFKRGRVYWKDATKMDLQNYDVVFTYLYPKYIDILKPKFKKELKKGSRIISNTFQLKGWTPKEESDKLYLYVIE